MGKGETENKRVKIKMVKDREDTQRGGKRKRDTEGWLRLRYKNRDVDKEKDMVDIQRGR